MFILKQSYSHSMESEHAIMHKPGIHLLITDQVVPK